jgi:hypothetical protein
MVAEGFPPFVAVESSHWLGAVVNFSSDLPLTFLGVVLESNLQSYLSINFDLQQSLCENE